MDTLALLNGLRFVDSFFPSGGFAFSSGVEAAVHHGAVRDAKGLARYVEDLLLHGLATREAVAVAMAHEAGTIGNIAPALAADEALDGMKWSRGSRLASCQMARQVMKAAMEQFQGHHALTDFGHALDESRTPGHLPVAVGLTLSACGWSRHDTVAAFLYQTAQGFVSAAMKLLPLGQQQGQHLLVKWSPLIAHVSEGVNTHVELNSWTPVQDIFAMRHARLESRLFRS